MPVSEVGNFPGLFEKLDNAKRDMEVFNISIKVTTMEDVFLKVGEMTDDVENDGSPKTRPVLSAQRLDFC